MKKLKASITDQANRLSDDPERTINLACEHSNEIPDKKYVMRLIRFVENDTYEPKLIFGLLNLKLRKKNPYVNFFL